LLPLCRNRDAQFRIAQATPFTGRKQARLGRFGYHCNDRIE
jgi:hypothetical protein